ncbi:MAG TPA: hypothetical protein VK911_18280, partial [Vicinamibacterales bacterium]|nr:hypothetical protein [Vicinamibacterales bacterium]
MTRATSRPRRPARLVPCLAIALLVTLAACGKKGPPLAPVIRLPAAPDAVVLQRRGDQVSFQFRVPAANSDGSAPADLARVEVYGYTGVPRDDAAIVRDGTLIASIPVRRPPAPEEAAPAGEPAGEKAPGSMKTGFGQGETVTVVEPIGAGQREVVVPSSRDDRRPVPVPVAQGFSPSRGGAVAVAAPLRPPSAGAADSRLYVAVGVSRRGRRGRFTAPARVSLLPAPSPPLSPSIAYDAAAITLTWEPPPDLQQPTLAPPSDPGLLAAKPLGMPSLSGGFNVYRAPHGLLAP